MSWQDVSVIQLRYAINDADDPYRYDDSRLQLAWLVGANYVVNEFTLRDHYTVDLVGLNVSPDPTTNGDQWMINLTTLRSAIMMISNDMKLAANQSFSIRDVHMQYDGKETYKANKMLLDDAKEAYDNLKMQYCLGANPSVEAVLTPINIISYGYRAPVLQYDARDRVIW